MEIFKIIWTILGIIFLIAIVIIIIFFIINLIKAKIEKNKENKNRHYHKFEHILITDKEGKPLKIIHKCECGLIVKNE
jgi:heme/copper-type cytochrome/quinol oxidase subunit 2